MRIGRDQLQLSVTSSHAGHVYLLMLGSDRKSFYLLFPNGLDGDNRIQAGKPLALPRPDWALMENVLLWLSVLGLMVVLPRLAGDSLAGWLNVPYFIWVSFAFVLNWKIVQLNRPFGGQATA